MTEMKNTIKEPGTVAFPFVDLTIFPAANDFLLPYLKQHGNFVNNPEEADFILALNSSNPHTVCELADLKKRFNKPIAWWSIEDPNSFETFIDQAFQAD